MDVDKILRGVAEFRPDLMPRRPKMFSKQALSILITLEIVVVFRCNFVHDDLEHLNQIDTRCTRQHMDNSVSISTVMNRTLLQLNKSSSSDMLWPSRLVFGSTVDSPPQSVTNSPSPSPTTMLFETTFDSLQSLWATATSQK